jgi:carotenoid cleavage dioxygenase-like enzyme
MLALCTHAHVCIAFLHRYSLIRSPYLFYGRLDADGRLAADFPVPLPVPVMMHDFAITSNFAIFVDCPLLFKAEVGVEHRSCFCGCADFYRGRGRMAIASHSTLVICTD